MYQYFLYNYIKYIYNIMAGCNTRMKTKIEARLVAHTQPGKSSPSRQSVSNQAQITAKNGLANSDGWTLNSPMETHLVAPFTSLPIIAVIIINPIAAERPIRLITRICLGEIMEKNNIMHKAGRRNISCRQTKCCSGRPILTATGGLAAITKMVPNAIRTNTTLSNHLSTVHHQIPIRDLSVLSSITLAP